MKGFDEAADRQLVEEALAAAVEAGVERTRIDATLAESAAEPDDDFRAPILAGRLHALARAQQPHEVPPRLPPAPWTGDNPE